MRYRRALGAAVIPLLLLAACNDTRDGPRDTSANPVVDEDDASDEALSILYVQHAILGTSETDDDGLTLTLRGVDQVTTWSSTESAGVLPTSDFVERWDEFGLADEPPQAALIPAAPDTSPVVVELSEPAWDPAGRLLTYQARVAADPLPRLADLSDEGAVVPTSFEAASLLIHQQDAPYDPSTPTTTTTTTTTSTTVAPPTTAGAPTTAPPSSATPTGPPITPPPSTAPTGPPIFVVNPGNLAFPTIASVRSFELRNIGSGLGSWSAEPQVGTGMSVTPSSGFLFPGSSVVISVAYNGSGPRPDFDTLIRVLSTSGELQIPIRVG